MMVYTHYLRRTSPRLLSVQACRGQQQLGATTTAASLRGRTTAPISTMSGASTHRRSFGIPMISSRVTNKELIAKTSELPSSSPTNWNNIVRYQHSSTQIKRLFKQNPAKRRIALKQKDAAAAAAEESDTVPESKIQPLVSDPKILANGWNVPIDGETTPEDYPFRVARTKNKPNNSVGFLPVYSEYRKDGARVTTRIKKISGDKALFLNELRAVLQIPIPKNPRDDTIRIRTGGTVEVKGNRVLEVKTWLAGLGF